MVLYFKNLLENEEPTLMPKVTLFLYLSKKYDAFSSANFVMAIIKSLLIYVF